MASKKKVSVTVTEAARLCGCSLAAVRQLLLRGRLPSAKKIGRIWVIDRDELEKYYALVDFWRNRHQSPETDNRELVVNS